MAVKVEPEGDVSEQEIMELKPVQEHGSEQEFVQVAMAKALHEGIDYEGGHCLPKMEAGEVSSAACSAQVGNMTYGSQVFGWKPSR